MMVRDLMTRDPEVVAPHDSLQRALETMLRFDIRTLPVVENDRLVGIITDRDVKMFLGPAAREVDDRLMSEEALDTAIEEVMTADVETVSPDTGLSVVCRLLVEFRIGALPVVDPEEGTLVGIISVTDCLSRAAELFEDLE
jgi:acetoin utilization protein AcuB